MNAFMCYLFILTFVYYARGLPLMSDEKDSEVDNPDNTFQYQIEIEDKFYGNPKNSTGDSVSKWSPSSNVFPEELGEYAEGDILHPIPSPRNGLKALSKRWTNKTIPYEISSDIRGDDRQMIYDAIKEFHELTCLKFKERSSNDTDYVDFTNDITGCWSSVGKLGGRQKINLQTPTCTTMKGTVIHEILHAVGFQHEQSRPDRDEFVIVNYNNIKRGKEYNFDKVEVNTTDYEGFRYDYRSVMHYSGYAFSKNGQPTIEPKVRGIRLRQHNGLSKKDVQKVQKMYECNKRKSHSSHH